MQQKVEVVSSKNDLLKVLKIREQIFVNELGVPFQVEFDSNDYRSVHLAFSLNESIIGTARMRFFHQESLVKLERLCLLPEFRGCNLLTSIMEKIKTIIKKYNFRKLFFLCESELLNYWKKKGFFELTTYPSFKVSHMSLYVVGLDLEQETPIKMNLSIKDMLKTHGELQKFVFNWELPTNIYSFLSKNGISKLSSSFVGNIANMGNKTLEGKMLANQTTTDNL